MSDQVWLALIAAVPTVIGTLCTAWLTYQQMKTQAAVKKVEDKADISHAQVSDLADALDKNTKITGEARDKAAAAYQEQLKRNTE